MSDRSVNILTPQEERIIFKNREGSTRDSDRSIPHIGGQLAD